MVNKIEIDINCDLGEGIGNEAQVMPYLSSCNIACGGHTGDLKTMEAAVILAKTHNVKVGAHPSFPDKKHFGRQIINLSDDELFETLRSQILRLKTITSEHDISLHHLKPHGALYNLAAINSETANIIIEVLLEIDPKLVLYVPYGSVIADLTIQKGVKVMQEGFADRNYNDDLTLVSRREPHSIIKDKTTIFEHVFRMISQQKIKAKNGVEVEVNIDTICVHGDHENVVENLKYLTQKLAANSIVVL
ncbi:MAG: 5-oxoprolinase subunit PxpA [Psychroserpens sp.]|nr:5-oxoprolinase subunit PxpA [Psychroserpens sp.]